MFDRIGLILLMGLTLATGVNAAPVTYTAILNGASESPPNASPATGFATVIYDSAVHSLSINVTFSDLIGTTTAAHIHCCTAISGVGTAGVATTVPNFIGFPLGVTSGSYIDDLDLTLASSFNPAFVTANGGSLSSAEAAFASGLDAGTTYFNIHTTFRPGGEIRGFLIQDVPEPSAIALVALGLAGLRFGGRRKIATNSG